MSRLGISILLLALIAVSGFAIPQTIQYQGKLTSTTGVGENDTLDIRFRIFDVETGGDSLMPGDAYWFLSNGNGLIEVGP